MLDKVYIVKLPAWMIGLERDIKVQFFHSKLISR